MDPVKIVDLAERLGLDKSTVSRALNNRPGVAPATRERITRMAREMGYSPNVHGQQLRGWKSTTFGLVLGANVPRLSPHFFGPFTLKLYASVAERGYDLLILSYQQHAQESIADVLVRRGVLGAVLLGWQSSDVLAAMSDSRLPCVQLDNYALNYPTLDFVCSDNQQGAYEITRHLLDQGHRQLSFVGDARPVLDEGDVTLMEGLSPFPERYAGFCQAMNEAGAQEIVCPEHLRAPEEATRWLLSQDDAPTAIVAVSDGVAATVSETALNMGHRIPEDLSLTGYDDVDPHLVESLHLTTVMVDQSAQADAAVELLLAHDPGRTTRVGQRIPTRLTMRASTAPPTDTGIAPPPTRSPAAST